jgi:ketosteroid isomerase-like protein
MPQARARAAVLMGSADDVEARFYEALASADLERLMAIWSEEDEVACVHPGGQRLIGLAALRASFESIFANGAIPVRPARVRRVQSGACAIHHVLERVDIVSAEGARTVWVCATNVYLKGAQGWRLVLHHASPGSEAPPEDSGGDAPTTLH